MTGGRIGMRVVVLFLLLGIRFRCRVKWVLFIGNSNSLVEKRKWQSRSGSRACEENSMLFVIFDVI